MTATATSNTKTTKGKEVEDEGEDGDEEERQQQRRQKKRRGFERSSNLQEKSLGPAGWLLLAGMRELKARYGSSVQEQVLVQGRRCQCTH